MEFVRSGKGLAGVHAATDSYHTPGQGGCPGATAPRGGGGGGGRNAGAPGAGAPGAAGAVIPGALIQAPAAAPTPPTTAETLSTLIMSQGDKNNDQKLSKSEFSALAESWFDKIDTDKAGKVHQSEFTQRFNAINPPANAPAGGAGAFGGGGRGGGGNAAAPAVARGSGPQDPAVWPEFNKMIGGYFKFHWVDPQVITVKIDDPKSPLTAMFKGQEFVMHDETYTFFQDSFSRDNVHVLTSIDYDKMSAEDKAKEPAGTARTDGDYALSYIRREGNGRVFYEAHGHGERNYAIKGFDEHLLAGIQYALGDLKADDTPSGKGKK